MIRSKSCVFSVVRGINTERTDKVTDEALCALIQFFCFLFVDSPIKRKHVKFLFQLINQSKRSLDLLKNLYSIPIKSEDKKDNR